jgi:hypothetical protein
MANGRCTMCSGIATIRGLYCEKCYQYKTEYYSRRRVKRWAYVIIRGAINRHKKNPRFTGEPDITEEFLYELFEKQGGLCYWFGVPMITDVPKWHPQRPTADRLDPTRGYTQDNIVLACFAANMGRNSNPPEVFRSFCDLLLGRKEAPSDTA